MDATREFLETSTIHGLSYISTAPSKATKILWMAIVITGFFTAGYLINNSYSEWQASPVSTSISTLPISDLDFPTITICPPEGSNTVLNYDLMKAANITLTDQQVTQLTDLSRNLLIHNPAFNFMKLAREMLNDNNIKKIFNHNIELTFPFPLIDEQDMEPIFTFWSSLFNGSFSSPGFGKPIDCNQVYSGVHFTLILPLVNKPLEGNESLHLNIKIEASDLIKIKYRKGSKFIFSYSQMAKKRADAEQFCAKRKGHLASIKNYDDLDMIDSVSKDKKIWLGGTDEVHESEWVWPDETPVANSSLPHCSKLSKLQKYVHTPCQAWNEGQPEESDRHNCLTQHHNGWIADACVGTKAKPFFCEVLPIDIKESTRITLKLDNIQFDQIEFWWKPQQNIVENSCKTKINMPGFLIDWTTKEMQIVKPKNNLRDLLKEKTRHHKDVHKLYNFGLQKIRPMVLQGKRQNMTVSQIWDIVIKHKESLIMSESMVCSLGYADTSNFGTIINTLGPKLSKHLPDIDYKESEDDLILAFNIFSYILFCNKEANQVYFFYKSLLKTGSGRAILQATVNNLKSKNIKEATTKKALQQLYIQLDQIVGFKSGKILKALSDTSAMETLETNEGVFFSSNDNASINGIGKCFICTLKYTTFTVLLLPHAPAAQKNNFH